MVSRNSSKNWRDVFLDYCCTTNRQPVAVPAAAHNNHSSHSTDINCRQYVVGSMRAVILQCFCTTSSFIAFFFKDAVISYGIVVSTPPPSLPPSLAPSPTPVVLSKPEPESQIRKICAAMWKPRNPTPNRKQNKQNKQTKQTETCQQPKKPRSSYG